MINFPNLNTNIQKICEVKVQIEKENTFNLFNLPKSIEKINTIVCRNTRDDAR